ncbi:MAG TPA: radical SAM family heme chaperone HemW [Saprospiraceae bacterium]|nr:radical SAM family heme chaperone HemW [Saprospiraceae bacterium]
MAGIYIHIPFCRQKCHYCNFHFAVSQRNKSLLIDAILLEIDLSKDYLDNRSIQTLYFGGGTPSLLKPSELESILQKIHSVYRIETGAEITLEANPDDIQPGYLNDLKELGINRLSLGVQSFDDDILQLLNRSHNAKDAIRSIQNIVDAGFDDFSIDLIFGMPGSDVDSWKKQLDQALEFPVPHFSFYNLTVEKRTALNHLVKTKQVILPEEEIMARQFSFTHSYMAEKGYEHYEISNYALPGRYARHNTAYWKGEPYLGIGPSAHSFNGISRQWNIANNGRYINSIQQGFLPFESEWLTPEDHYNEYLLTRMRTMWGCELDDIRNMGNVFERHFLNNIAPYLGDGRVIAQEGNFSLSLQGMLFADAITSGLFFHE